MGYSRKLTKWEWDRRKWKNKMEVEIFRWKCDCKKVEEKNGGWTFEMKVWLQKSEGWSFEKGVKRGIWIVWLMDG